tara:strand:- start:184 stop:618 length:435 start_codon:yes stop_codon:yes gene_type:complete
MGALDNLKADFERKLAGGEMHPVDFPEIGVDCFVRDVITANRRNMILKAQERGVIAMGVEMIINTLKDANDAYIFKAGDNTKLMRDSDSAVLERVAMEIMPIVFGVNSLADLEPAAEVTAEVAIAEKNSKATAKPLPGSSSPTS